MLDIIKEGKICFTFFNGYEVRLGKTDEYSNYTVSVWKDNANITQCVFTALALKGLGEEVEEVVDETDIEKILKFVQSVPFKA